MQDVFVEVCRADTEVWKVTLKQIIENDQTCFEYWTTFGPLSGDVRTNTELRIKWFGE